MPDYEKLFYQSQARLADLIDELEKLTEKVKDAMLDAEEKIISDESDGDDVGWTVISDPGADGQRSVGYSGRSFSATEILLGIKIPLSIYFDIFRHF